MTFAQPFLLLGVLALPLAAIAYVRHERARRAAAAAVVSPALLASLAPRTPGWRRHLPVAFYALALAVLLVALARPQSTVAVPVERAGVMVALDASGSMLATDVKPERMAAAQSAGRRLLDTAPKGVRVGLVVFDGKPRTVLSPTAERESVGAVLDATRPAGGTATGEALAAALRSLDRAGIGGRDGAPGAIVLISDGKSTAGRDPLAVAQLAKRARIKVHAIALGTASGTIETPRKGGGTRTETVPPDVAAMREVARISGGRTASVTDADALGAVLEDLGSQVGTRDERREVTTAFAGGALLLLVLGGGASLRLSRRLPL